MYLFYVCMHGWTPKNAVAMAAPKGTSWCRLRAESKCVSAGFRGTRTFQRSAKPIVSILGSRNDSLEFSKEMKKREISHIIQKSVGRSWFRGTSHWNPFGRSIHTPTLGGALVFSLPSWCRCFGSYHRKGSVFSVYNMWSLLLSKLISLRCSSNLWSCTRKMWNSTVLYTIHRKSHTPRYCLVYKTLLDMPLDFF